ncbi:GREB1-like protein [Bagarius yarrelli]|uniref:GREB1-like protein n=1 Tax=Bagarius yarrelli TaxID=175774 RepID=A0A556V9D5_BAGYA|nr:GREB1-like protein [Bagarius yarrelli]
MRAGVHLQIMGNSYAGQLKSSRFEEALHNSIEASLRSSNGDPQPIFTQLYLEPDQYTPNLDDIKSKMDLSLRSDSGGHVLMNCQSSSGLDDMDDDDESDTSSPPLPYLQDTPPDGCCTVDGFCQAGKDIRLVSVATEPIDIPAGFELVGAKSPSIPEHILVCAVDKRFLPDENGKNALLEFSNHINLKLSTQPKKQKHLKYHLVKNPQGALCKGTLICWKDCKARQFSNVSSSKPSSSSSLSSKENGGANSHIPTALRVNGLTNGLGGESRPTLLSPNHTNPLTTPTQVYRPIKQGDSPASSAMTSGPPKKRHRSWHPSPVMPVPSTAVPVPPIHTLTCGTVAGSLLSLTNQASGVIQPQPITAGETVIIPDNLLNTCGVRPIILIGTEQIPMREEFEQIVLKAAVCGAAVPPITAAQLPWLARVEASVSGGSVQVLLGQNSLGEGIAETLRTLTENTHLQQQQTSRLPNYVLIIHTPATAGASEFCVMVLGKYQSRALAEGMLTTNEFLKEISYELITGKVSVLASHFNNTSLGGNLEKELVRYQRRRKQQAEHSNIVHSQEEADTKVETETQEPPREVFQIYPPQLTVARSLLSLVCGIADSSSQNLDLGRFCKVDFLVLIPPSNVLLHQTARRIRQSGVLVDLGMEDASTAQQKVDKYVVRLDNDVHTKMEGFMKKVRQNPYTLFVLIHDNSHIDLTSVTSGSATHGDLQGLADRVVNSHEVLNAENLLLLQVTSFPYTLQSCHSRISIHNEVHWPSNQRSQGTLSPKELVYFGLKEYQRSVQWGVSSPILRCDDAFERMVNVLLQRHPHLHSMVIRSYLLIQQYTEAMMALTACPALREHVTPQTLAMVEGVMSCTGQGGRGNMLLVRVPSLQLARLARERLEEAQHKLGLERRFAVVLGGPTYEINLTPHFCTQLRAWRQCGPEDWTPVTYEDLEDLPCIVILTGKDPLGETFPRSLKYCDLRLIDSSFPTRTALEQEIGVACSYATRGVIPDTITTTDKETGIKEEDEDELERSGGGTTESDETQLELDRPPSNGSAATRASGSLVENGVSSSVVPDSSHKSCSVSSSSLLELANGSSLNSSPKSDKQECDSQCSGSLSSSLSSTSSSSSSTSPGSHQPSQSTQTSSATSKFALQVFARTVVLSRAAYRLLTPESVDQPSSAWLLPHGDMEWISALRLPIPQQCDTSEQSVYYRQWTKTRPQHADYNTAGSTHPRRLLLSGPPQVGKTGAYLQFLRILFRMLIRLLEVDVYDEEELEEDVVTEDSQDSPWPDLEEMQKMTFDLNPRDPKFKQCSAVYSGRTPFRTGLRQEDYNESNDRKRKTLSDCTFHAFSFCSSMLGEEVQLHFIIPKNKEHHFVFSQQEHQLESMRLPLLSDQDGVKSTIFTPTTGRQDLGLLNLHHALEGAPHLHILVVKQHEMALYRKFWPNHVLLVLPSIFNNSGVGAARFMIKELAYHNLELERNRQEEQGVQRQNVWPFILIMDDSCVLWNAHVQHRDGSVEECNVSLKSVLLHIEGTPSLAHYAMCGLKKWSSRTSVSSLGGPFSRCHLHDFVLLNVDLTQNVQYDLNRIMKKHIPSGSHQHTLIKPKLTTMKSPSPVSSSLFVCAPDSVCPMLDIPAQLLLERFLQRCSTHLFPHALHSYTHPVLAIDTYLDLGPQVQRCVVSQDRSSLRQTIARLELEDEWQFRLRDEFQTANCSEDRPLYFLTGRHI